MTNSNIPTNPPSQDEKAVVDTGPKMKKCSCGILFKKEDGVEYKVDLYGGKTKRNYVCSEDCLDYTRHQYNGKGRFSKIRRVRVMPAFTTADTWTGTTAFSQTVPVIINATTGMITLRQTFINE